MKELEIRQAMCDIGRRIQNNGYVAANDGNITVKLSDSEFLTTATGVSKGYMTPDMIVKVNAKGEAVEENQWKPSSEVKVHLKVYEHRPDVRSVVHTHPPFCTLFAILGEPLDLYMLPETVINVGCVPIVPYALPSSMELADSLIPYLQDYDAYLLENHGLVTVGPDLTTAYFKTETVEYFGAAAYRLKLLGAHRELSRERIDALLELREKSGAPGRHPGYRKLH